MRGSRNRMNDVTYPDDDVMSVRSHASHYQKFNIVQAKVTNTKIGSKLDRLTHLLRRKDALQDDKLRLTVNVRTYCFQQESFEG